VKILWVSLGALIPLSLVAFPIVFWAVRRSAERHEPVRKGLAIQFGIARGAKLLLSFVVILLVAFTIFVLAASLSPGANPVAVIIPVAVIVAIGFATPHAVVLDDIGINQRRLLLPDRHTRWEDVSSVARDAKTGRTFVWSNDGKIAAVFSPFFAGHRQFVKEIRVRAKHAMF